MTQLLTLEQLDELSALENSHWSVDGQTEKRVTNEIRLLRKALPVLISMAEKAIRYEAAAKALILHDDMLDVSHDKTSPTHLATYADAVMLTRKALKGETE